MVMGLFPPLMLFFFLPSSFFGNFLLDLFPNSLITLFFWKLKVYYKPKIYKCQGHTQMHTKLNTNVLITLYILVVYLVNVKHNFHCFNCAISVVYDHMCCTLALTPDRHTHTHILLCTETVQSVSHFNRIYYFGMFIKLKHSIMRVREFMLNLVRMIIYHQKIKVV